MGDDKAYYNKILAHLRESLGADYYTSDTMAVDMDELDAELEKDFSGSLSENILRCK